MAFVGLIFVVIALIHFYLWKRLVRDTIRPGRLRKAGAWITVGLAILVPVTLIGVRAGYLMWLAWPGYLWVALMFYLLVVLVVLEIPRLVISLGIRVTSKRSAAAPATVAAGAKSGSVSATDAGSSTDAGLSAPAEAPAMPVAPDLETGRTASPDLATGRTAAPDLATGRTAAPDLATGRTAAPDLTTGPTAAPDLATGRTAAPDLTTGPTAAPDLATGRTAAPDLTTGPTAAPDLATGRTAAPDLTTGPTAAPDLATGRTAAPDLTTGPTAAPDLATGRTAAPHPDDSRPSASDRGEEQPTAAAQQGEPDNDQPGIDRRLLLARGAAIFAGLTAAGITGYGVKTALGPPQLDRVQLPLAKLPRAMDGTRLAVVSDIHLGPLTGPNHAARIVQLINSVNADVVCIVGDLVDGRVAELGKYAAPLADIQSRRGAYFVTGNHEYYSGFQEWVDEVARLNVRPLRNERLELDGMDLAGVNDLGGTEFDDGPDLQRALGDRDTTRPVVLMAHQPIIAQDAAPFGVDLQVSGHTHGGQMAPFNLLVKLEQPVVSGLGKVDGVPVYVTNGAGFWGPPVRVGAPPQVSVIELRTP
ncbi:putative metallophosphoesterase [Actinoplanes friuliensis DSM 7358]|uniref:Putative metallophosphoesterase n=1 Tax=Actinoplanes friuliensis DSM 7358 TaxID=1246995 RepID=U5WCA4_9ACTN|nr:putative metallophosphoesterase [Actinoplanes friuliensis DSM 7358]